MISIFLPRTVPPKSSAAICAATTEPIPLRSEYRPDISARTPIFTPSSKAARVHTSLGGRARWQQLRRNTRHDALLLFSFDHPWKFIAAPNPLRGLVFRHCNHGAGERAVGLPQLIQNREVIGVGDRYQVTWDMPLRPVGMVIAAARDHSRQLAGAVGDTQRLVHDRPPHRRELLDFLLAQFHLVVDMRGVAQRAEIASPAATLG